MSCAECPYCGTDNFPEGTDYDCNDELTKHEYECGGCGKKFLFRIDVEVRYDAEPCDCLNGDAAHDWEKRDVVVQGKPYSWLVCRQCGEEREGKQMELELTHG